MTRPVSTFLSLFALVLGACATTPPVTGEACGAARAVLIPVISAVIEEGGAVELGVDTSLFPPASQTGRWDQIRDFGFAPVWRSAGTDEALRRAYWDAWQEIDRRVRLDDPEAADLQAWEAAYDEVGDDRVFPDQRLWTRFLDRNQSGADFTCAADIASATGAVLVSADTPRAPGAMRLSPAAPGLQGDRALMSARAIYPPLEADGAIRETGTIWLLRFTDGGDWRVLSARRVDAME